MNESQCIAFDGVAGSFSKYDTTLRGHVRYQVTRRSLEPFLTAEPMRVLDIGGGSGPDAAWLASLGHQVTVVESSKEQLVFAERRFNFFLSPEERALITIVEGDLADLKGKPNSFDLVLCHGVAMYQPHPTTFVSEAAAWAKPGGVFSLLEKGYYGAEARAIRDQDFDQLDTLHSGQRSINNLGIDVRVFTPEALENMLEDANYDILQWSGVRLITDQLHISVVDMNPELVKTIIDAEFDHGNNPAIRAQGQMLHFIARKKLTSSVSVTPEYIAITPP